MSDVDYVEPFQLIATSSSHQIFSDYEDIHSAHGFDPDTSLQTALRLKYPELALTVVSSGNGSYYPSPYLEARTDLLP